MTAQRVPIRANNFLLGEGLITMKKYEDMDLEEFEKWLKDDA